MTTVADSSVLVAALVDSGSDTIWVDAAFADEDLACPELALRSRQYVCKRDQAATFSGVGSTTIPSL